MEFFSSLLEYNEVGLTLLRLAVGIIFLTHGLMKLGMWKMTASPQMPGSMLAIMRTLSIVEPVGGVALMLGVFTQIVSMIFVVVMLGAIYFKISKWGKKFTGDGGWELDFILLAANLALILGGGGAWGLDRLLAQ